MAVKIQKNNFLKSAIKIDPANFKLEQVGGDINQGGKKESWWQGRQQWQQQLVAGTPTMAAVVGGGDANNGRSSIPPGH